VSAALPVATETQIPSAVAQGGQTPRWPLFVAALLLTAQAGLLAWGGYVHSPVYDETAHLPAGLSWWLRGRTDLYPHNPLLVKVTAAAPVALVGANFVWDAADEHPERRPEFKLGRDFAQANGRRTFWLFTLARWACIPFATLAGVVIFLWSRSLYGELAGLASLALWCFGPNVLANAQLIVPDAAATAFMLASAFTFRGWLLRPTWRRSLGSGVFLGLALLSKYTSVTLWPLWCAIWAADRLRSDARKEPGDRPSGWQLVALLGVSLLVVNAGYGFRGTLRPLADYQFHSQTLSGEALVEGTFGPGNNRFRGTAWGWLPVPLPVDYVRGIDLQKLDFETGFDAYLRGEWRIGGWWYWYLYALAVKVPTGTLALAALAVLGATWRSPTRSDLVEYLCLLGPPAIVLALVSSQTGVNMFLRYVLPVLGFLAVALGACFSAGRPRWQRLLGGGLVAWSTASSLAVYPHSISYFNEIVGGPNNGPWHLLESNVRWGQDLLYVADWLDAHDEVGRVGLLTLANFNPELLGIDYFIPARGPISRNRRCDLPDAKLAPQSGWYVVDLNYVYGMKRPALDRDGEWASSYPGCDYTYFQSFEPVARIGYSTNIYHITPAQANEARRHLGLEAVDAPPNSVAP